MPRSPRKKTTPIKPPAASDVPDWVRETPEDLEYQLGMWDGGGGEQIIQITRKEFIDLKFHLAKLRGIEVPAEVEHAA